MTTIFWLDLIFHSLAAVLSLSICLSVLGADPTRRINQLFVFFVFSAALWEILSIFLKFSMWLGIGDWETVGRIAALAYFLTGPSLLLFTSRYIRDRKWHWDLISIAGIVLCASMVWPLFDDRIIINFYFNETGTTHYKLTLFGMILQLIPAAYFLLSAVLLWIARKRIGEKYLSLSVFILFSGLVLGGFVDLGIPIMALGTGAGIALLGYAVLRVQLFNPLRVRNTELQCEVAERRKIEIALSVSEADMKGLLSGLPDAIFSLSGDGTVLNYTWPIGFDVDLPRDIVGKKLHDVLQNKAARAASECLDKAMSTGVPQMNEFTFDLGKKRRFYELRMLKTSEQRAIAIFRDVTRKKELEGKVLQSGKMEAIGRFAGGVAHDFNNILSVMLNFTNLSINEFPGPTVPGYHEEIKKAILKASELPRQLLAFSKKQVLDPKIVSLNQIITDMKAMLGSLLGEDIELVVILDPGLGYVKVDPVQMQQVILNLAANAREALPKGGRITFSTHDCRITDENRTAIQGDVIPPGAYVKFTVEDNGTGMDPDTLAHAFEPFFTTKDERVGIGLGLATVHGIVMQSSGFIHVASEVGTGTRFEIFLPVAQGVPAANIRQSDPVRTRSKNLSILVVEDEESIRYTLKRILESSGFSVILSASAEEAIDLIGRDHQKIDILLSDVIMKGGKTGVELSSYVQSKYASIKTILMSGYTDDIIQKYGTLGPGMTFLQKPFDIPMLLKKIDEVTEP